MAEVKHDPSTDWEPRYQAPDGSEHPLGEVKRGSFACYVEEFPEAKNMKVIYHLNEGRLEVDAPMDAPVENWRQLGVICGRFLEAAQVAALTDGILAGKQITQANQPQGRRRAR